MDNLTHLMLQMHHELVEQVPPWEPLPTLGTQEEEQEYGVVLNAIMEDQFALAAATERVCY
jgi:hypothetical protein